MAKKNSAFKYKKQIHFSVNRGGHKRTQKSLRATFIYNQYIAKSFHNTKYYESSFDYTKNFASIEETKDSLSTAQKRRVYEVFNKYKNLAKRQAFKIHRVVYRIKEKIVRKLQVNRKYKKNLPIPKVGDILSIVGNVDTLITAYRTVKKNRGAMTAAWRIPEREFNRLSIEQQNLLNKLFVAPDAIDYNLLRIISTLVKDNNYPWGTSRLIWIPKPGTTKLRPLTIPPFADRIVQEAIRMVLEAIFEPIFQQMNCTFGFRASNGVHQAIAILTSKSTNGGTNGFTTAIEGDIESAYPNVNRDILLQVLSKHISDKKFLSFMKKRLNLRLFDMKDSSYKNTLLGIPQGGIDSPLLWNIYLLDFDIFIHSQINEIFAPLNDLRSQSRANGAQIGTRVAYSPPNPPYKRLSKEISALKEKAKASRKHLALVKDGNKIKWKTVFKLVSQYKSLLHNRSKLKSIDPNRIRLRFSYVRYADDWIIFTNAPIEIVKKIKALIAIWLKEKRDATLSDEKTLITDMRVKEAHFLGFEFMNPPNRHISRDINGRQKRKFGWIVKCKPDKQRLINRMYMKGYCDETGFPREVPWLSTLELYVIIQRFNSVLRGLANFYAEFLTQRRSLSRWLYIIRWSAIKTIAKKYKLSCRKVFLKFGDPIKKSISTSVEIQLPTKKIDGSVEVRTYTKSVSLLNITEVLNMAMKLNLKFPIQQDLLAISKGKFITYKTNRTTPRILDTDFLNNINWVNARTRAGFDLPCAHCGNFPAEMHHIKHVRMRKFSDLNPNDVAGRMMAIRNRKQIPLCVRCHDLVHSGEYRGPHLGKLYCNSIVSHESSVTIADTPFFKPPAEERLLKRGYILKNTK